MRSILGIIIAFVVLGVAVTSCELHTYSNGDFDGYWKLKTVDSLSRGSSADFTDKKVFWSVQAKLLTVRNNITGYCYTFRFRKTDDSLMIYEPYYSVWSFDTLVTDVDQLREYGVNALETHFKILLFDGDNMVLEDNKVPSESYRLHFVKF